MKIYSAYKTTDQPWGGANNFLRALWLELSTRHGVIFVDDLEDADIAFFNQSSTGPGAGSGIYSLSYINKIRKSNPALKVVMRAINLERLVRILPWYKYFLGGGYSKDKNSVNILNESDFVIYQSNFQKKLFDRNGVKPKSSRIIYNGAAKVFCNTYPRPSLDINDKLVIVSVSFSNGEYKLHSDVARMSKISGVRVHHIGKWPKNVDSGLVILEGVLTHDNLVKVMSGAHYLFHPSSYDICPNAVVEALHNGMPVIYNPHLEAGVELVGDCGMAFDRLNPEQTVYLARMDYRMYVDRLSSKYQQFGIARAAEDYYAVFSSVLGR